MAPGVDIIKKLPLSQSICGDDNFWPFQFRSVSFEKWYRLLNEMKIENFKKWKKILNDIGQIFVFIIVQYREMLFITVKISNDNNFQASLIFESEARASVNWAPCDAPFYL